MRLDPLKVREANQHLPGRRKNNVLIRGGGSMSKQELHALMAKNRQLYEISEAAAARIIIPTVKESDTSHLLVGSSVATKFSVFESKLRRLRGMYEREALLAEQLRRLEAGRRPLPPYPTPTDVADTAWPLGAFPPRGVPTGGARAAGAPPGVANQKAGE